MKCDELKADKTFVFGEECEAYKKSEADKVIAELEEKHKTEVKELLCLIRDKENNFNRAFDSEEKEIRHHKYKRCLAMASRCFSKSNYHFVLFRHGENIKENDRKSKLYLKWRCRWLAIADKFKEEN